MSSVLDLPIEKQKEIAKACGYADFSLWQQEIRLSLQEVEAELDSAKNEHFTKAEIERKIHDLKTNPYAIEFYRRITDNYDLTVEEQIKHLRSLKTVD